MHVIENTDFFLVANVLKWIKVCFVKVRFIFKLVWGTTTSFIYFAKNTQNLWNKD